MSLITFLKEANKAEDPVDVAIIDEKGEKKPKRLKTPNLMKYLKFGIAGLAGEITEPKKDK